MIHEMQCNNMAWKKTIAMSLMLVALALPPVSTASGDLSDLKSLVSNFDDPLITENDLAFFLATHGFDASPEGDHVEVDLDGQIIKLTPNGQAPGLCSLEFLTCSQVPDRLAGHFLKDCSFHSFPDLSCKFPSISVLLSASLTSPCLSYFSLPLSALECSLNGTQERDRKQPV